MRRPLRERVVIAGKYRLDRELARGGMGSVWVARHLQLDVPVAIKFMEIAVIRHCGKRVCIRDFNAFKPMI